MAADSRTLGVLLVCLCALPSVALADYPTTVRATSGLIGYWRLNERTGTVAADQLALNNGTYLNTPTLGVGGGLSDATDTAVSFNGINEYATLDATRVGKPASVTVECWAMIRSTKQVHVLVTDSESEYNDGWLLNINTQDHLTFNVNASATVNSHLAGNLPLALNTWYHLVGVYDAAANRNQLYVNGVLDVSETYTSGIVYSSARKVQLAGQVKTDQQTERYLDGALDEVAIYGRVLTAAEILSHFQQGRPAVLADAGTPAPVDAGSGTAVDAGTVVVDPLDAGAFTDDAGSVADGGAAGDDAGVPGDVSSSDGGFVPDAGVYSGTGLRDGDLPSDGGLFDLTANLGCSSAGEEGALITGVLAALPFALKRRRRFPRTK